MSLVILNKGCCCSATVFLMDFYCEYCYDRRCFIDMGKVLFFIQGVTNSFAASVISYMGKNFSGYEKEYYIFNQDLTDKENTYRVSCRGIVFDRVLRKKIKDADKIIVSGVFLTQYVWFLFFKRYLPKTYFQFWGGDFYHLSGVLSLREKVEKQIDKYCIKKSAGIILLLEGEKEQFLKIFPTTKNKKFFFTPVPFGEKEEQILKKYRVLGRESQSQGAKRILVGNSATKTNKHFEIFNMLKSCGLRDVEIVCPLSYGNNEYREKVIFEGKKLFGELFVPIVDYMDYEEYTKLLMTCLVGIYNFERQQGLGNIFALLNMGKKVYLNEEGPVFCGLTKLGFQFGAISQIKNSTKEEIFAWCDEKREKNFLAFDRYNENMLEEWRRILND